MPMSYGFGYPEYGPNHNYDLEIGHSREGKEFSGQYHNEGAQSKETTYGIMVGEIDNGPFDPSASGTKILNPPAHRGYGGNY